MKKKGLLNKYKMDFRRNKALYLLFVPVILFYALFCYKPMYGAVIAFMDYRPARGISGSEWVGLENFARFFRSPYFERTLTNTLTINVLNLIFGFPAPIILALLLNEVKCSAFKRVTQTITYLPHFISTVIVCGMITDFCLSTGVFNDIIAFFGGTRSSLLMKNELYRPIYIISGIWQEIGWSSIIYLAALSGVDQQLYEAAKIDGAGKWKQTIHVTLPGIMPVIIIQLILRIGRMMSLGYEKTLLLYSEATYEVADIISTFVYRQGLLQQDYSYSTAVGLFNSVINCLLLFAANFISKRTTETSLW